MALETQNIDIPLTGGLSTKLDAVLPDKSRLLASSNGTFNKRGTLSRRDPVVELAGSAITTPSEMMTLGGELLTIDGATNNLYSYSATSASVVSRGKPPYLTLSKSQISRAANGQSTTPDCAVSGQYTCFAWQQLSGNVVAGIQISIYDETSGTSVVSALSLSASSLAYSPKIYAIDTAGTFAVVWVESTTVRGCTVTPAGLGIAATTLATTAVGGGSWLDATVLSGTGGCGLIAYYSTRAGATVAAIAVNASLAITTAEFTLISSVGFPSIQSFSLVADGSSRACIIATQPAGPIATATLSSTNVGVVTISHNMLASTMASSGSGDGSASGVFLNTHVHIFSFPLLNGSNAACEHALLNTLTNGVSSVTTIGHSIESNGNFNGPFLVGRPFLLNGAPFAPVGMYSTVQPGIYFLDVSGGVQGVALYGSAGLIATYPGAIPSCPTLANGSVCVPVIQQGAVSISLGNNTTTSGVSRISLSYGRTGAWHAMAANCIYFSGSYMGLYDGAQCVEAGFMYFPDSLTLGAAAGAGVTGTFSVLALYEWVDAQGQRHQSSPSAPVSITLANNGGIICRSAPLLLGGLATACSVVFFRTVDAGTTYYRINPPTSPVPNDPTAYSINFTDTTPTSSSASDLITANEILYTTGGALPNDNPPACNAIAEFGNRIIYGNAEDPQDWRFSQYPVPGQGLYFNETLLGGRTPLKCGAISAFGVLDDKLIVATATNKLVVTGTGPASTGTNGSFSPPQLLPSDVGVIDQRTVATIPDLSAEDGSVGLHSQGGMVHQSKHGIYLLDRSLVDRYIGMGADAYVTGQTITSVTVAHDKHQLRFTVPSQAAEPVLVYDYLFGQWSTFLSAYATPQCATIFNGLWTFGFAGLWQDNAASIGDSGVGGVVMSGTTAWIRLGAMQGFQRVREAVLFGPYSSASSIVVGVAYDYNPSVIYSATVLTSTVQQGGRWQFRWTLPRQKCEAIQFSFTDTPTGNTLLGVGVSGITLGLGVKRGRVKLPAGQSA